MPSLFDITKPFFHALDPETAHKVSIAAMKAGFAPKYEAVDDPKLKTTLWGRTFNNPIGLAAGFDKNAEVIAPMLNIGFGFVEVGTVTPKPQDGNPRPRVFRDVKSEAVINRMGFPNGGLEVFKTNLVKFLDKRPHPSGIIGINIGMNKTQKEPAKDYCRLIRALGPYADYFTINISSPNTPGLRNLQDPENLQELIEKVLEERKKSCGKEDPPPLLVKFAPDLDDNEQHAIANTVLKTDINGIIVTNTTLDRPDFLPKKFKSEQGGLSGKPLTQKSTDVIRNFYKHTGGKVPIIGIGGVSSGQDAYDKICAGASLVQLYSALVFHGPELVTQICRDLVTCLDHDGHKHLNEAIGSKA
ncbi:MAG: quinone-dependent dihydroorotate dehydrogenase [Pseudomonadota bacterium]